MLEIPKRYLEAYPTDWESDSVIYKLIAKYTKDLGDYFSRGMAPAFLGNSGTGKTRAAAAVLNYLNKASSYPLETAWCEASDVFNTLMDYKDLRIKELYSLQWSKLKTCDLLVIDDFSTLQGYSRLLEHFWRLLEHRYNRLLPTIYTGNFAGLQSGNVWSSIENWFTPAISRRIKETSSGLTVLL